MKLAVRLDDLSDEYLRFHAQLGVHYASFLFWDRLTSEKRACGAVKPDALKAVQAKIREFDIEPYCWLLPQGCNTMYWNARFGQSPEADKEIENVCESIRVIGDAGIPVIEWTWSIPDVFGRIPGPNTAGRGGAQVSRFNEHLIGDKRPEFAIDMDAETMWHNLSYFMDKIMPVAEASGVKMAMHHHDPPTQWLAGEARILGSFDGMKKMIEMNDSPSNGFNICQGTITEQAGTNVYDLIRYFGERDRIFHCHFRNVRGSVPVFDETFIDDGDIDMVAAMRIYKEVDYQHCFIPDHVPTMAKDPEHLASRAFAVGYIAGLMDSLGVRESTAVREPETVREPT